MARPGVPPGGVPLKSAVQTTALSAQQQNQMFANLLPVTAYPADGAIAAAPGLAVLTKAGVGAYTLGAPPADGIVLEITNGSANAHVITATSLIMDGVTGQPHTTITFTGGFVGEGISLRSFAGKWNVMSKNIVAIT